MQVQKMFKNRQYTEAQRTGVPEVNIGISKAEFDQNVELQRALYNKTGWMQIGGVVGDGTNIGVAIDGMWHAFQHYKQASRLFSTATFGNEDSTLAALTGANWNYLVFCEFLDLVSDQMYSVSVCTFRAACEQCEERLSKQTYKDRLRQSRSDVEKYLEKFGIYDLIAPKTSANKLVRQWASKNIKSIKNPRDLHVVMAMIEQSELLINATTQLTGTVCSIYPLGCCPIKNVGYKCWMTSILNLLISIPYAASAPIAYTLRSETIEDELPAETNKQTQLAELFSLMILERYDTDQQMRHEGGELARKSIFPVEDKERKKRKTDIEKALTALKTLTRMTGGDALELLDMLLPYTEIAPLMRTLIITTTSDANNLWIPKEIESLDYMKLALEPTWGSAHSIALSDFIQLKFGFGLQSTSFLVTAPPVLAINTARNYYDSETYCMKKNHSIVTFEEELNLEPIIKQNIDFLLCQDDQPESVPITTNSADQTAKVSVEDLQKVMDSMNSAIANVRKSNDNTVEDWDTMRGRLLEAQAHISAGVSPYLYELKTVLVHKGVMVDERGKQIQNPKLHHYCFSKDPDRKWRKYDDEKMTHVSFNKVQEYSQGGANSAKETKDKGDHGTAIMFVYLRKDMM
jgi:hypothetical protein